MKYTPALYIFNSVKCRFPNIAELYTYRLLAIQEHKIDFENVSKYEDRISKLSDAEMIKELEIIVRDIYTSEMGGPKYFIITAAERGAFYGETILYSKNQPV